MAETKIGESVVYKWGVPLKALTDYVHVPMPTTATLLTVASQHGYLCFWWRQGPNDEITGARRFRVAGTGHPIMEDAVDYVGTVQFEGGLLVFHVFEVPNG